MRIRDIFNWWFGESDRVSRLKLLRQQRRLLQDGLCANAEVIDARVTGDRIGAVQPVKLWLRVQKPDGSFIYTQTNSMMAGLDLPARGQVLHIKYMPQDLSTVVIL